MPQLTPRRDTERQAEHWLIFADDLHIGSMGVRSGAPMHADQRQLSVSLYPASHQGIRAHGTAHDFPDARDAFERAWRGIEPRITKADRLEHRRARAWTAWKQQMWKCGCKLPTQMASGRSQCYCGAEIDNGCIGPHGSCPKEWCS